MDVNRADAVTPVGTGGGPKQERKRDSEDEKQKKGEHTDDGKSGHSPWDGSDAVAVDAMLAGMTPEIQKVIDHLTRQVEPLRAEVERARGREAHFRELAEKHSFLPIPGRREFLRELGHVMKNMQHMTPPPTLVVLHLANADELRRRDGREALDGLLSHVCGVLEGLLHPTDVVGSIGGNDFGIILLVGNGERARTKAREIADTVRARPFMSPGGAFAIESAYGVTTLSAASSAEAALAAADRDLVAEIKRPEAAAGGR